MTIDILAALHEANPTRGARRCKVQKILDAIPDETPGKPELSAASIDYNFPAKNLSLTFSTLGTPVGHDLISDHRAHRCACYR